MEEELRAALISIADLYAEKAGCAISTVGRRCRGESSFFSRIANPGNSFTARTFDDAMTWFAVNWPHGEDLPSNLRRYLPSNRPQEAA